MLGKLALIGTLGLCTAFGLEHRTQEPDPPRNPGPERQDPGRVPERVPERVIEELERRIERMAEAFEERFEERVEALEEALEAELEAAEEELEARLEALEEEFEARMEALEEQIEERMDQRLESVEEERGSEHDEDHNCTPSRASRRDCTPSRSLISRFERAHDSGDRRRVLRAVDRIVERHGSSLSSLNSLAWELLTDDDGDEAGRHDELALALAERMMAQRERLNHYMKDTVALALFRAGEVEQAVELQREAIAEGGNDSDYRRRLATYEQALQARVAKKLH